MNLLSFIVGAMIGSFLNVVIARLPDPDLSIVRPRSRCPKCAASIPAWLNIPILSFLMLRGRCRQCREPISIRYPIVELLTGVLFMACFARFGRELALLWGVTLCAALVAITFIDIDHWEVPDEISLPGILLGCALRPAALDVPWFSGLAGAALGAVFLGMVRWGHNAIRKREGIGMGDVKLIAMIGAFLGPGGLAPVILLASALGVLIGGLVFVFGRKETPEEGDWRPPEGSVPFGPFLALGALSYLLFEPAFRRLLFHLGT